MTLLYTLIPAFLLFLSPSSAHKTLGINCRGSGNCGPEPLDSVQAMYNLFVNGSDVANAGTDGGTSQVLTGGPVAPGVVWQAGEHIACQPGKHIGGICMFMQGNVPAGGVDTAVIIERLGDLQAHGCTTCGSVPLSGDNNPNEMGILTLNFVKDGVCQGLCTQGGASS